MRSRQAISNVAVGSEKNTMLHELQLSISYILIRRSMRALGPFRPLVSTKPSMAAVAAESENLHVQLAPSADRFRLDMGETLTGESRRGCSPDDRVLKVLVPQLNVLRPANRHVLLHHVRCGVFPSCGYELPAFSLLPATNGILTHAQ